MLFDRKKEENMPMDLNLELKDCRYIEKIRLDKISANDIKNICTNLSNINEKDYYNAIMVITPYYDKENKCIAIPLLYDDRYHCYIIKTRLSNKVLFDAITDSLHDLLTNKETKKDVLLALKDVIVEASKIINENN